MEESLSPSPRVLRFGTFEVDLQAGELRKYGLKIKLQEQPFKILAMLLQNPGEVVLREQVREKLWAADTFVDFEHALNRAVNRLREALGDSADSPRFVETLPRRGYRFIAPVSDAAAASPHASTAREPSAATRPFPPLAIEKPAAEMPPISAARPRVQRVWVAVGVFAVLLISLAGLDITGCRQRLLARAVAPRIESIAVLPLENLSGDPEQEYFADGMTDALITNLAQISSLRVISRTSVMGYKGTRKPLQAIGRELNVEAVLEGTVVRFPQRVRITSQLVHAPTGRLLWAKSYERNESDLISLQADVARAIVTEIGIKLTPREQLRLAKARPLSPEAYEAYLRGRYFWNNRTEISIKRGIEYFEQAIQKDPDCAQAFAGLADSYSVLGFYGMLRPNDAFPKSKAAALRALEIDDTLAEAHTALASNHFNYDWDWSGAEREFKRAIELNPNYGLAHVWYGLFLRAMGREAEWLNELRRIHEVDPLSPLSSSGYLARGQYDSAIEELHKTLEMHPYFAFGYLQLGRA